MVVKLANFKKCEYETTLKGSLTTHERTVHEYICKVNLEYVVKLVVKNVSMKWLEIC